jgi:hypothetical protein
MQCRRGALANPPGPQRSTWRGLAALWRSGVAEALTAGMFMDLDRALECAERPARNAAQVALASGEYPFELLGIVRDIDPEDREALR